MKISELKAKLMYLAAIGASIFALFFVITCSWIGYDVKSQCEMAKMSYAGDCVQALTALLDDKSRDNRSRNSAVWALGQLGDERALPILEKYYTGQFPDREPLDQMISQYELKKAISLANGGTNISAWAWRSTLE